LSGLQWLSGRDSSLRTVQPLASRFTDWAIVAHSWPITRALIYINMLPVTDVAEERTLCLFRIKPSANNLLGLSYTSRHAVTFLWTLVLLNTTANNSVFFPHYIFNKWLFFLLHWLSSVAITQSVKQLAKGRTVRGSNPDVGDIFRTRPDRPWGPPSLLYSGYRDFPGVKLLECGVDNLPHLDSRSKKE